MVLKFCFCVFLALFALAQKTKSHNLAYKMETV